VVQAKQQLNKSKAAVKESSSSPGEQAAVQAEQRFSKRASSGSVRAKQRFLKTKQRVFRRASSGSSKAVVQQNQGLFYAAQLCTHFMSHLHRVRSSLFRHIPFPFM